MATTDRGTTLSAITITEGLLKFDYRDTVRDVLNNAVVLNYRLERDYESVSGDRVWFLLNTGRNNSFASRPSSSPTLPTAGSQEFKPTFFTIPEMYGRFEVSVRDLKASRNQKGAFLRILDAEMTHLIRDAKVALNRMNYGDGTAYIARIDETVGATADVDLDEEAVGAAAGTVDTYYAHRFLRKGTEIGFVPSASKGTSGSERATTATVVSATAGDTSTKPNVVTDVASLSGAGVTDNDWICIAGSQLNDQMGLLGIVDDGDSTYGFVDTIQGIQRTTAGNEFWQGVVLRNAGTHREIYLDLIQEALDTVEEEGDGRTSAMLCSYGIRRKIVALLQNDKRFTAPYHMDLMGGFEAVNYNNIPIFPDRDCPRHMIFGLDEPSIKFYQMSDLEWMEEDGAVLSRKANEPKYEATLFLFREMACSDMKNNFVIKDLFDPSNPTE